MRVSPFRFSARPEDLCARAERAFETLRVERGSARTLDAWQAYRAFSVPGDGADLTFEPRVHRGCARPLRVTCACFCARGAARENQRTSINTAASVYGRSKTNPVLPNAIDLDRMLATTARRITRCTTKLVPLGFRTRASYRPLPVAPFRGRGKFRRVPSTMSQRKTSAKRRVSSLRDDATG